MEYPGTTHTGAAPLETLRQLQEAEYAARINFKAQCEKLCAQGTPVEVVGYPISVSMATTNPRTGEVMHFRVPVYSLLDDEREPRVIHEGLITSVNTSGTCISVAASKDPNARIYSFMVDSITSISPTEADVNPS